MEELVFTIPTGELWKILSYEQQGLINGNSSTLKMIVRKGLFRERNELEEDPSFKQVIPYGIISCEDSFYLFRRSAGQTEKRLHDQHTLGVGGHMNPGSLQLSEEEYIFNELKREFYEEVKPSNGCHIENIGFIGFINDDTIPVSRVHLGVLYNIRLSNKNITINEPAKLTGAWVEKSVLGEYYEVMETWTKIAYNYYINFT
jgi:predicted NUDIX family phosphoesterase